MTECACGHTAHKHSSTDGECHVLTITGPPTPKYHNTANPELHMGRTVTYCPCRSMQPTDEPGTGAQVQTTSSKGNTE